MLFPTSPQSGGQPKPQPISERGAHGRLAIDPLTESEGLDLVGILSAIEETAYVWDMASDAIEWESNAATVLGVVDARFIATGRAFQSMIIAEHAGKRIEAISAARSFESVRGVPYRLQYRFVPGNVRGGKTIWLEDHGRWWPGPNGVPVRARGVIRVVNERYWEEQRLIYRNDDDELTGQLNRIRLTESLSAVIERARTSGGQNGFLVVAVNNLSVINETFGFDIGDEVIAAIGRVLKQRTRAGDIIGRYSSNKFGVLLHDCGPGAMQIAAERFLKAVRDTTIKTSASQISATVSIGGVIFPEQAASVQLVVNNAMSALDKARIKRFECFTAYEPGPNVEAARRRKIGIADDIITALDHNRMQLLLQPMVNAKTGVIDLYECLLRMGKADGTIIAAGDFIPVAEQLGLSRLIDRRTLELSVELLKRHKTLKLSINVSGLTASDQEWVTALKRLTGTRRELTERMIVEITETAAIQDIEQSIDFVNALKMLGCKVAIDDFGAGYTSFKNLKALNVDIVKIDGAFVKNVVNDTSDQVFIKTMIELARSFNMETVAECVSDDASVALLREAGITYLQGFHCGMPTAPEEIMKDAAQ